MDNKRASLAQTATVPLLQQRHAAGEIPAQVLDLQILVHTGAAQAQASCELVRRLLPAELGQRFGQAVPESRDGGLVEHGFLQMPWLRAGVMSPKGSGPVLRQRRTDSGVILPLPGL